MLAFPRAVLPLLVGVCQLAGLAQAACREYTLDFILLAGDALSAQMEDDIRKDLAKIGVTVNTRLLQKADFNKAMQDGDFHMCFTETWGPPYDPHSYATSWFVPKQEAHYAALGGLEAPMTMATLQQMVTDVLKASAATREAKWTKILKEMHKQAISNPMWSRRMPAVMNRRLQGYTAGEQQFDYPMHSVKVFNGSKTVTLAPGAQTGLFSTTGPMDPHSYRPNEFFISNWIYEGLVYYGRGGAIEPMLATSWTSAGTPDGGQEYRFTLRQSVKFHDGTAFNCAAAKMNFDHVLQPPLDTDCCHGWYGLPKHVTSWRCDGETFVVKLSAAYYPFLQELSLIRPLRMLSPQSFADGPATDPVTRNSCPPKWNPVKKADGTASRVNCTGIRGVNGTGPWVFRGTTLRADGSVSEARFARNPDWWGARGDVEQLVVKGYQSSGDVEAALLSKTLDMVVGGGVLTLAKVEEFQTKHVADFQVVMGPPLMNTIVVMNAAKAPTSDLHLRKLIMHAIDKASIVAAELAGAASVADSLFPKAAPYCDVDLTPRYDYDFEKASLMNCPTGKDDEDGPDLGLILGLALGLGLPLLAVLSAACFFIGRRSGYKKLGGASGGQAPAAVVGKPGEGDNAQ